MSIISSVPTPAEAVELRALYHGNVLVDLAERAVRAHGDDLHAQDAVRLLDTWRFSPDLTTRERRAVIARFVPPPPVRWAVAEHCPTCAEVFHPEQCGVGEQCRTCQYRPRAGRVVHQVPPGPYGGDHDDSSSGPGWPMRG